MQGFFLMRSLVLTMVLIACGDDSITNRGPDAGGNPDGPATADGPGSTDGGTVMRPPQVPAAWKLALSDDFDGTSLRSPWNVGTGLGHFTVQGSEYWKPYNDEPDYMKDSMVRVQNSTLILS